MRAARRSSLASGFWRHDRAATLGRAALASVPAQIFLGVLVVKLVLVVVHELRARRNSLDRFDPDMPPLDHGFAIRIAGMIDVHRIVAAHRRVDARAAIQREEKGVMAT